MKTKFCVLPSLSSTHTHTGGRHQSTALPSFTVFTVSLDSNDLKKKRLSSDEYSEFWFFLLFSMSVLVDFLRWCFVSKCFFFGTSTEFYRVLPSFTEFYWVLPSFTEFYWVLPSFTGFYWVLPSFTGFYRVLLGFTKFYLVLLGFTGFLTSFTGVYWVLPSLTGF